LVHMFRSGVKGSLSIIGGAFVCREYVREQVMRRISAYRKAWILEMVYVQTEFKRSVS